MTNAKTTYRVSTGQFEYIEYTTDDSPSRAVMADLHREFIGNEGLAEKRWNEVIDNLLWKDTGVNVEDMEQMNENQLWFLQQVKKSMKRTAYKEMEEAKQDIESIKNLQ